MRVPVSWLRDWVEIPAGTPTADLEAALVRVGLEVEAVHDMAASVTGPLVVGTVLGIEELTGLKKPIRYCQVDVGETGSPPRGVICGAANFAAGDRVAVALPGAVLPGGFAITARRTYGHVSDGMICSARELGLGDDHTGILVLDSTEPPGTDARASLGLDDVVIELAITPDRGYCFSMRGIARELSHALGVAFRDPAAGRAPGPTSQPPYPLRVADPVGCDRFAARAVLGVDPAADSPSWMKRRLTLAGMRPISLTVDITNYLMLELGQPMHAFDLRTLSGEVVVRRAFAGESLNTLDGMRRTLDPEDMVICDDTGVISLAGIMGGATTEVSASTVDVLFEAAHWDPVAIARASRRHRLSSEAGKRFERGVDPEIGPIAVARAVALLTEHAGGTVDGRVLDIAQARRPAVIHIAADLPSRVAGVDYAAADVVSWLEAIGCRVAGQGADLDVTPPTWRPDLVDPADLAEEVIRLAGYDQVPSELPVAPPGRGLDAPQRRRRTVARALAEAGYVEVLSYPFVDPAVHDAFGLADDDERRQALKLANPLSEEEPELRTSLLPPLLATLRRNLRRGHRDVALFELGLVFSAARTLGIPPVLPVAYRPSEEDLAAALAAVPDQPWHAAAVVAGAVEPGGWWGPERQGSWADAVQAARIVAAAAGAELVVRPAARAPWHPGRCGELTVAGRVVGYGGELHPAVCAALELPERTCAMEIDISTAALPLPAGVTAPPISTYPPALIDVALLVRERTPAAEVEAALAAGAGELLESLRLFDVFSGPQLGEGHKSLAYKLVFRAPDRTLTAEDAVAARDAAVAEAARRVGAVLRGV